MVRLWLHAFIAHGTKAAVLASAAREGERGGRMHEVLPVVHAFVRVAHFDASPAVPVDGVP
jgi:hypothetical protein